MQTAGTPAATPPPAAVPDATMVDAQTEASPEVNMETIADLAAKNGVEELVALAHGAGVTSDAFVSKLTGMPIETVKGTYGASVKRQINGALTSLGRNENLLRRYCTFVSVYPTFSDLAMIGIHASTQADFSGVLEELEAQLNECEDSAMREALVNAYQNAAGYRENYANRNISNYGEPNDLKATEALLEFVREFKDFLTPDMLQFAGKNAIMIESNMPALAELMSLCQIEDKGERKALAELFAKNPQACGSMHILLRDHQNISLELINLCKEINKDGEILGRAAALKELSNVNLGTVENLLRTCDALGCSNCVTLVNYAREHPNVDITAALVDDLKENPHKYKAAQS
jgi:hypothetical protein